MDHPKGYGPNVIKSVAPWIFNVYSQNQKVLDARTPVGAAQPVGGDNGHEGRHHVQRPMRHVDDPQGSENEGEPCCHDEQVGRVGQPTHREQQELARIHE